MHRSPGTSDFLTQQLRTMESLKAEQSSRQQQQQRVGTLQRRAGAGVASRASYQGPTGRRGGRGGGGMPSIPDA